MNRINRIASVILTLFVCWTNPANAQEVEIDERARETIDNCLEAMGSQMALSGVGGVQGAGTMELEGAGIASSDLSFSLKILDDKVWMGLGELISTSVSNGKYSWRITPTGVEDGSDVQLREIFPYPSLVLRWLEDCKQVKFIGDTTYDEKAVIELEFQPSIGKRLRRYFDKETGLLVGQKMETTGGEMSFSYQYAEIDGISFVTGITARQEENYVQNIQIENEVDVEIDESVFEVPDEVKQAWKEGRWPGKNKTESQKLKRDR